MTVKTSIPIAPTLKKLEIYKTANFSLSKYGVVNSTIQRIMTETDLKFTQKKNKETRMLDVTRIA